MYDLSDLRRALRNPHLLARECNRLYHTRLRRRPYNTDGIDLFAEDWDNLVILDACRYDIFESHAELPGRLDRRESRAGATPEFVRANFRGRSLDDTVYVTGNSWFFKLREEIEASVHAAFHEDHGRNPSTLTDRALDVAEEFDRKRLVVHYIPPHHPFAGPTAERHLPPYDDQLDDLFPRIRRGEVNVSNDVLRQAYVENLERVMPEVRRLLDGFEGKTVVTADHGELLGERCRPVPVEEYGHHAGVYVDELVAVPWHVHETGERRTIVAEESTADHGDALDEDTVDERLRNLGYKV